MKPVMFVNADVLLMAQDPGWSHCTWRLLAEGDSWFSIGSLNLPKSANLLFPMAFDQFAAVVQTAHPGDTLRHMSEVRGDPRFEGLLTGPASWRWDGILLSCGGNDLIDAAQVAPHHPRHKRLLRPAAEWGPASQGAARYISTEGWDTFARYFCANLDLIFKLRDRKAGEHGSRGRPVFMHTYAYATPRPSGAGLGQGPWLLPAMKSYAIPKEDWIPLARALVDLLADLLLACEADTARYPGLHVFDSRQVPITPAALDAPGESGDWINEIHLTHDGARKIALPWCAEIEATMLAHR